MSGKLYQIKKECPELISNNDINEKENFEMKLLDNFHCTITCIRILSLVIGNSVIDKNFFKNFVYLCTTKGSLEILYNSNKGYIRLHKFIAHKAQPGNTDNRFGSLNIKAEVWSITLKEKHFNINENKFIVNIISASEDQTIKIWEINLFNFINSTTILNEIFLEEFRLNSIGNSEKEILIEEKITYKNHDLAVTSVDCKIVNIMGSKKRILVSCSDDKIINIYDAENEKFPLIKSLTTKDRVFGWHTLTYLCLEEV